MMKPSMLKKQIIREFAKNKKLTVFQKKQLTFLITSIRVDFLNILKGIKLILKLLLMI